MPRHAKIHVVAYGKDPDSSTRIYEENVATFEVQLYSSIKVVNPKFRKGIDLSHRSRTQTVEITSSSDF